MFGLALSLPGPPELDLTQHRAKLYDDSHYPLLPTKHSVRGFRSCAAL